MRDVHASGFHGATAKQWAALAQLIAANADLAALTECRHHVAPTGWAQYRPDTRGAECVILWHRDAWRSAGPDGDCEGAAVLTDRTFYTGTGAERPGVVATWKLLQQIGGDLEALRVIAHFPASVQRGDGFSTNLRRVLAWRSTVRGLRRALLELAADLRPDEIVGSADFNVDLSRAHWRLLINRGLRGTGCRVKPPAEGTHGDRGIDGHFSTMHRVGGTSRVLRRLPGFDHRPVAAEFKETHR